MANYYYPQAGAPMPPQQPPQANYSSTPYMPPPPMSNQVQQDSKSNGDHFMNVQQKRSQHSDDRHQRRDRSNPYHSSSSSGSRSSSSSHRDGDRYSSSSRSFDRYGGDRYSSSSSSGSSRHHGDSHHSSSSSSSYHNGSSSGSSSSAQEADEKPYVREELGEEDLFKQTTSCINFDKYEDIPVTVEGKDIPKPVATFAEANLAIALQRNIAKAKYEKPTPIQKHSLPILLQPQAKDIMACAQTGSGKTVAFLFPLIQKLLTGDFAVPQQSGGFMQKPCPLGLIIAPTRELATQIYDEARKFTYQTRLRTVAVYGGADSKYQINQLYQGVQILVGTPGRLIDMVNRGHISLEHVKYLVLDEADRCLDMGFEPQIREIVSKMPDKAQRQTLLYSATFPKEIQQLAKDFLNPEHVFITVGRVGSTTDLITQKVHQVPDIDKPSKLMEILKTKTPNDKVLIFTMTKIGAERLGRALLDAGLHAIAIHGDKHQRLRDNALKSFKSGFNNILVATDVAARGLDVNNITLVVNYDLPKNIDDYIHRIGRTGRAGKKGEAVSFYDGDADIGLARELLDSLKDAKQEVPPFLYEEFQRARDIRREKRFGKSGGGFGGRSFGGRGGRGGRGGFGGFGGRGGYGGSSGGFGGYGGSRGGYGGSSSGSNYRNYGGPSSSSGFPKQ